MGVTGLLLECYVKFSGRRKSETMPLILGLMNIQFSSSITKIDIGRYTRLNKLAESFAFITLQSELL